MMNIISTAVLLGLAVAVAAQEDSVDTEPKMGTIVKRITFDDATAGKLAELTFTLNPVHFTAPKDGYMNLFLPNAFNKAEDAKNKVTCKYSINQLNPDKAVSNVDTAYIPGTDNNPAEIRLTLKEDMKSSPSDILRIFCKNVPLPEQAVAENTDGVFILSDKKYSPNADADLPAVDRLVEGVAVDKIYSKEEGGAPHVLTIYAVSVDGTRPLNVAEINKIRDSVSRVANIPKEAIEFIQTTVTKEIDSDKSIVMTLFRINSKDHSPRDVSGLLGTDGTKNAELQADLEKSLTGYTGLKQTFAEESISGTCYNGIKDANGEDAANHETDVDCGGANTGCIPCDAGKACLANGDCKSGSCNAKKVCDNLHNSSSITVLSTMVVAATAFAVSLLF